MMNNRYDAYTSQRHNILQHDVGHIHFCVCAAIANSFIMGKCDFIVGLWGSTASVIGGVETEPDICGGDISSISVVAVPSGHKVDKGHGLCRALLQQCFERSFLLYV